MARFETIDPKQFCPFWTVIDIHVDNYLKDILAFVHYGSIVHSRPKNYFASSERLL